MGALVSFLSSLHEILDADNLDLMRRFALVHGFGDSSPRSSWHIAVGLEEHGVSPAARKYTSTGRGVGRWREREGKRICLPQGSFSRSTTGTTSFPWGPLHITFGKTFNIQTIAIGFKPVLKLGCQNHLIGSLSPASCSPSSDF